MEPGSFQLIISNNQQPSSQYAQPPSLPTNPAQQPNGLQGSLLRATDRHLPSESVIRPGLARYRGDHGPCAADCLRAAPHAGTEGQLHARHAFAVILYNKSPALYFFYIGFHLRLARAFFARIYSRFFGPPGSLYKLAAKIKKKIKIKTKKKQKINKYKKNQASA